MESFADTISRYNCVGEEAVRDHAPLVTKTIKIVLQAPWFDSEYKNRRKQRRKAEKKFRKTRSEVDRQQFVRLRKETTDLAYHKKRDHYSQKLVEGE